MQEVLITLDMEGISDLLRNNPIQYHKDKFNIVILYEKFKVRNRELKKLRENYYIDLAKDKLAVKFF
jgi:hypothetical protein